MIKEKDVPLLFTTIVVLVYLAGMFYILDKQNSHKQAYQKKHAQEIVKLAEDTWRADSGIKHSSIREDEIKNEVRKQAMTDSYTDRNAQKAQNQMLFGTK